MYVWRLKRKDYKEPIIIKMNASLISMFVALYLASVFADIVSIYCGKGALF